MASYIQEKLAEKGVFAFEEKKGFIEMPYKFEDRDSLYRLIDFPRKEGAKTTLILSPEIFSFLSVLKDGCGNYFYDKANNVINGFPFRIDTTVPKGILVIEEITYHPLNEHS